MVTCASCIFWKRRGQNYGQCWNAAREQTHEVGYQLKTPDATCEHHAPKVVRVENHRAAAHLDTLRSGE
jgi:hypothetical protein